MEFFENSKYKIKKPACKFCSCYQHGLAERICNLNVDWRGIPVKAYKPDDICENFSQVSDGSLEDFRKAELDQALADGSVEKLEV